MLIEPAQEKRLLWKREQVQIAFVVISHSARRRRNPKTRFRYGIRAWERKIGFIRRVCHEENYSK